MSEPIIVIVVNIISGTCNRVI